MGRHSAPVLPAAEPTTERPGAGRTQGPITDPRLFDHPLPPARRAPGVRAAQPPVAAASRATEVRSAQQSLAAAGAVRAAPARSAALLRDAAPVARAHQQAQPFEPVAVRTAQPTSGEPVVPQVAGTSLLGLRLQDTRASRPHEQRYARTGPVTIVSDAPVETPVPAPSRKREAALAAAALAVVGAMSGAAALLPSNTADAQTTSRLQPVTAPAPSASGGTSTGGQPLCFSPQQIKRAMRHHHLRRTGIVHIGTPVAADPTASGAPSSPSDSPSPSASSTASASSTPSASTSASASPSPSASSPSSSAPPISAPPAPPAPSGGGALPADPSNLGSGTYTVRDFATQTSGAVISRGALRGAGVGRTVVQMTRGSSTKAGLVPGNGNNQGGLANPVNPLYLLRGVSDLQNVTVQGTEQGHLYNGLYMTGPDLLIKHVVVDSIPGDSNANPGETFAIGVNRASGNATVEDLTINGGSGALASSAGLAINNSTANWNIDDLTTRNLRYSAGIALWQVRGTFNVRNYVQSGGARSLGAERMAGTVNLYDPRWSAGSTGHDITYTWDGGYSGGRINFYYSSASQVPNRKINVITNKVPGIASSVHVYIGGVEQNASKYVTVN